MARVIACSCAILLAVIGSITGGYALGIPALANGGWAALGVLLLAGAVWYAYEDRRLKRERAERE